MAVSSYRLTLSVRGNKRNVPQLSVFQGVPTCALPDVIVMQDDDDDDVDLSDDDDQGRGNDEGQGDEEEDEDDDEEAEQEDVKRKKTKKLKRSRFIDDVADVDDDEEDEDEDYDDEVAPGEKFIEEDGEDAARIRDHMVFRERDIQEEQLMDVEDEEKVNEYYRNKDRQIRYMVRPFTSSHRNIAGDTDIL